MRNSRALPFTVTYRCYTVQRRVCFLHNDSSQLPQKYFAHLWSSDRAQHWPKLCANKVKLCRCINIFLIFRPWNLGSGSNYRWHTAVKIKNTDLMTPFFSRGKVIKGKQWTNPSGTDKCQSIFALRVNVFIIFNDKQFSNYLDIWDLTRVAHQPTNRQLFASPEPITLKKTNLKTLASDRNKLITGFLIWINYLFFSCRTHQARYHLL